ncbi:TLC domain-containing protein At5g14285-like [Cornus florida]|uniref:TLC domain-containing protein At5g14285-like n=1 Tax=Cornus florida TaxID=4283 RepID=UPI002896FCD2|nr:TLC domain-containing protein At5g14285-like [Cornus florida]
MEILSFLPPTLPVFVSFYIIIYLLGYFIIFRKWRGINRAQASSCLLSIAHATPAVLLASYSMLSTQNQLDFASPNTEFQNMVLEYSIAYFFIDLLHYIFFIPNDALFIAHHLATLYVFVTCRYVVHHGAFAILVLLILAEVTSPCQNTWSLARYRKDDVPAAAKLCEFLSLPFYAFYSVVRGVFGPLFVYKMGVFYTSRAADGVIPIWASVSWMVVIVSAIFLSILWVLNLWIELYRERATKELKKLS